MTDSLHGNVYQSELRARTNELAMATGGLAAILDLPPEALAAVLQGGEGELAVGGPWRHEAAGEERNRRVNQDVGVGGLPEAVLRDLRQFDVRHQTAAARFVDEGPPAGCGSLPVPGAGVAAGGPFEGFEALGAGERAGEGGVVVRGGGGVVAGILGRTGRLERVIRPLADRGQVGRQGDQREDVPGV